jgi:cell division protein FtsB
MRLRRRSRPRERESAPVASRSPARSRPSRSSLVLRWSCVGALVLVGLLYYRPVNNYLDRRDAVHGRQAEVAVLSGENEQLTRRLRYVESEEAVAREARRLGYVKPGERLFIVKGIPAWRAEQKARATIGRGG